MACFCRVRAPHAVSAAWRAWVYTTCQLHGRRQVPLPLICDISAGSLSRRELFRISLNKRYSSWRRLVMHRCSTRLLWFAASSSRAPLAPWPLSRMERCLVSPALHALAGKSISHDTERYIRLTDPPQSPLRLQPRCLRRCLGDERLWQTHGRLHRELFEDGLAGVDP